MIKRRAIRCTTALLTGLVTLAYLGGCASTDVAPLSEQTQVEPDEPMLMRRAQQEEDQILRSGLVADLPETESYLQGIALRLAGDDATLAASLRVRIVQDPTLNAFALPNGSLFVHTGLLARLDNEAQIATILAHEMSHVNQRHALRRYRQTKTSLTWLNVLTVTGGGYGSILGGIGTLAAVSGYSRELEHDADRHGFDRLRDAGYDLYSTTQVFEILQFEAQRSERKQPFFFGSHPRLADRLTSFGNLLVKYGVPTEPGRLGEADYQRHLPAILRLDIAAGLQASDLEGVDQLLQKLETLAAFDAQTPYLRGEWHRKGNAPDRTATATAQYRRALTLDSTHALAWRGLGLSLGAQGTTTDATAALQRYLDLAPLATDRAHMLHLISSWKPTS